MGLMDLFKSQPPTVMVVDDDPMLLDMYEVFLEAFNCKTVKVNDSREAAATAEKCKPVLIILDISMPVFTGLQLLDMLKAKPTTKNTPVLMITGERSMGDIETAFKLGAADYVCKPVDRATFEQKVRPLLEKGISGSK